MGLRISTNLAALAITRRLNETSQTQLKSYTRLASGQRITQAGDDAAGMAISESFLTQIRSMRQASRNAQDATSLVQVAEGTLSTVGDLLIRLRELAIESASDTFSDRERGFIQQEVGQLTDEIDRIANSTQFNGIYLLKGDSRSGLLRFQVGINGTDEDGIELDPERFDARAFSLGVEGLNFETRDSARGSIETLDEALGEVFSERAELGALQNRLQSASQSLDITQENLEIARSRIADTDIATETTALVRGNILQAMGVAVLAQANSSPALALKLIDSSSY